MTEPRTKVVVVIPVHNRRETTLQALRSLSRVEKAGLDIHIVIVDDGSTDGTSDAIRSEFPSIEIVPGDGTLHYAAGTNLGIEAALLQGADFILIANDDAVFHESFLRHLVNTASENPKSIIGALLLLWDDPNKVFQVDFKWKTFRGGWQQPNDVSAFALRREPFKVEGLAGNCVLVPAAAIRECGVMDAKKFPHGWGDIQYFVRMRKQGWQLLVEPKAYVWCEPNSYPPPLHTLSTRRRMSVLFRDRRHPLNLHRQFIARWESAPSKTHAVMAFAVYLLKLATKSVRRSPSNRPSRDA